MKKSILFLGILTSILQTIAQIKHVPGNVLGSPTKVINSQKNIQKRGLTNPSSCGTDTTSFTDLSSTGYPLISVGNGQQVGQYFGTPQEITVKGFRFFAYVAWDTVSKVTFRNVYAKIYSAGPDSLPRGAALDSVLVRIDTVSRGITFARLAKDAVFSNPVVVNSGYILSVECADASNIPAIVTNSWTNGDGENRNLSCINLNNRWYRGKSLAVGGITFNAHFQIFPFVTYTFGTDFKINNDCYLLLDSFNFENQYKKSVVGSVFYNNYMYYVGSGFDALCHTWTYDNKTVQKERLNGKFRPGSKKNINIKLTSYVVPYSVNLAFCFDSTEKTMYYKPGTPALTGTSDGCVGDSLRLRITPNSDITNRWYHKETDTLAFNVGDAYTIKNVTNNDTFYITAQNGSCLSRAYTAFVTANQTPSTLTGTNDSVCSDASAILKASSDVGDILWYRSAVGGTAVLNAKELVTGKLNADTTYYAEANNKGCLLPSGRIAVTAFVNADFAPPKPTGMNDTSVCYSGTNTDLTLKAFTLSSASIRWFDVATAGSPISQTNDLVYSITGRGAKTFYVETWDGRCGSGRVPVKVNVSAVPTTFAKVSDEICFGDSADIAASASWGKVNWYANKNATTPFSSNKFVRVGGLTQAKSYAYFKTAEGICESADFDSVEITVNIPPTATIVSANDVCKGANASIELSVNQGSIIWFFDNAASASIATGSKLNLGELFNTATRYYETELNGCRSARNAITIKALDRPDAGFQFEVEFPRKLVCTPINTNNMTIVWDFGDGNTSTENIGINTYANEGQYDVKMVATSTISACKDSISAKITINHNNTESMDTKWTIYPNPVSIHNQLFTLKSFEKATWYDLSGREIFNVNLEATGNNNNNDASVIPLPPQAKTGIYILELESNNETQRVKIQIQD